MARNAKAGEQAERGEIGDFIDDVLDLIGNARERSKEDLEELRERVSDGAQRLKETASEQQQRLREAATEAAARADDYAHENPWQVAAIAAVVGLALGVLIARR